MNERRQGGHCPHGMGSPDWCSLCRQSDKPTVYITAGGMHYHAHPSCSALKDGQAQVANPAPIHGASLGSAHQFRGLSLSP